MRERRLILSGMPNLSLSSASMIALISRRLRACSMANLRLSRRCAWYASHFVLFPSSIDSIFSIVFSMLDLPSSHSQTVIALQPMDSRRWILTRSRSWFRAILFAQNSVRVFGMTNLLQPLCPCQKQPFTKMQVRYLGSTMSGVPGNVRTHLRNLYPRCHNSRLTVCSGRVSFECMLAIHSWRWSGVMRSGMVQCLSIWEILLFVQI